MSLWTSGDLKNLGHHSPVAWQATGVSIDTRTLQKGDMFIALKGPAFNGNNYIDQALQNGAAVILTDRDIETGSRPIIKVDDCFTALQQLAQAARARSNAKIIAVTGSVGKTGTKEMLAAMLSDQGRTHYADKSFNNHIGVPLTLARMPENADYAVFEIGMNHAGEIAALVQMVQPHAAIITTIEDVHLAHFRDRNDIADAKAEIFDSIPGTVILPRDNICFDRLLTHAHARDIHNILTFGVTRVADAQLMNIKLHGDHSIVDVEILGNRYQYRLGIPGHHIAINSLAALLGLHALGGDIVKALPVLANLKPYAGRGARQMSTIGDKQITVIDESYNASPAAVRASLQVLKHAGAQGRTILCLGDMLELGDQSAQLHMDLKTAIAECNITQIFTCGALTETLFDALPEILQGRHYGDSAAMAADLANHLQENDTVLVKGSAGSKMKIVVDALSGH